MIEAEHGPDSAALLVTHSKELIENVISVVKTQLDKLSQKRRSLSKQTLTHTEALF